MSLGTTRPAVDVIFSLTTFDSDFGCPHQSYLNLNFPNSWQIGFVWIPFSNSIRPGSINIQSPCLLLVEVTTWHLSLCTDDHPPPGPGPPSLVTSLLIFSTNLFSLQWSLLPITLPAKTLWFSYKTILINIKFSSRFSNYFYILDARWHDGSMDLTLQ